MTVSWSAGLGPNTSSTDSQLYIESAYQTLPLVSGLREFAFFPNKLIYSDIVYLLTILIEHLTLN